MPRVKGIPVYDLDGVRRWESLSAAARHFDCDRNTLGRYHVEDYQDGLRLKSTPDPVNQARGHGVPASVPVIGPAGERWKNADAAAAALGCCFKTIYRHSKRRGDAWHMLRYPPRVMARREEVTSDA